MSYSNSRRPRSGGHYNANRRSYGAKRKRPTKTIDPARFVMPAKNKETEEYQPKHKFTDFALNNLLHDNLSKKGYVNPSPIQDKTIPAGIEGRDVIGIAGTGTGKTAAFALPVLHKLMFDKNNRALVIAPTRELAEQIEAECKSLASGSGLFGALLIGGTNIMPQLRALKHRPNIIIGTPGRIKDHIDRGSLNLHNFNLVVLDEVDRMLDMGFVDDVRFILDCTAQSRQMFFFSATMEPRVQGLINGFVQDPKIVTIQSNRASDNVHQDVIRYRDNQHRLDQLHDLLAKDDVNKVIVFDETQRSVERLGQVLSERGFSSDAIHGGKTQGQRQRALRRFKNNEINILVATDVASRGIDISDITHVINFTAPQEYEDYIHRVGRAGRAGRSGYAYTFITH
ncbi:DEAD/DEAH box helicase [Candidatus Saccharibacteria bacterium]|nr:DEAD/DEAH box helicase [Candidatus Saccharibacteria bacterium]